MNWYTQIQMNQMLKEAQRSPDWARILTTYGMGAILTLATLWGVSPIAVQDAFAKQPQKVVKELEKVKQTNNIKKEVPKAKSQIPKTQAPKVDPNKVDPNKVDPNKVDPNKVDPNKVDPNKVDPNQVDPNQVDPNQVDAPKNNILSKEAELKEYMDFFIPMEGKENVVYEDPGKKGYSIGVGFFLGKPDAEQKLEQVGTTMDYVMKGKKLTNEQVFKLFAMDMKDCLAATRRQIPNFDSHPAIVKKTMAYMVYTLGPSGFAQFKNMKAYLNNKNYKKVAENMKKSKWYTQVSDISKSLADKVYNAKAE